MKGETRMGEKRRAADGGLPDRNCKTFCQMFTSTKVIIIFRKGGEKCHIKN